MKISISRLGMTPERQVDEDHGQYEGTLEHALTEIVLYGATLLREEDTLIVYSSDLGDVITDEPDAIFITISGLAREEVSKFQSQVHSVSRYQNLPKSRP